MEPFLRPKLGSQCLDTRGGKQKPLETSQHQLRNSLIQKYGYRTFCFHSQPEYTEAFGKIYRSSTSRKDRQTTSKTSKPGRSLTAGDVKQIKSCRTGTPSFPGKASKPHQILRLVAKKRPSEKPSTATTTVKIVPQKDLSNHWILIKWIQPKERIMHRISIIR